MIYPLSLINEFKSYAITREEFCMRLAAMQGFDGTVTGIADSEKVLVKYRNRQATLKNGVFTWDENGQQITAYSVKELKIKIDILEAAA